MKKERGVSFEEVELKILEKDILDIILHPNKKKYPHQKIFIIQIGQYVYAVPFVENEDEVFLKTIFPDRKLTKKYLK